jgi:hypothetical protein
VPVVAAVLTGAALLGAAAIVLAAQPIEGAKYKGKIRNDPVNTKISFRVSDNGNKVRRLKTRFDPVFFSDGCNEVTPSVEQESEPADISGRGKFRGVIRYTYTEDGGATAKAVVKGRFRRHGRRARGRVIATFPANPNCDGTARFRTHVVD